MDLKWQTDPSHLCPVSRAVWHSWELLSDLNCLKCEAAKDGTVKVKLFLALNFFLTLQFLLIKLIYKNNSSGDTNFHVSLQFHKFEKQINYLEEHKIPACSFQVFLSLASHCMSFSILKTLVLQLCLLFFFVCGFQDKTISFRYRTFSYHTPAQWPIHIIFLTILYFSLISA